MHDCLRPSNKRDNSRAGRNLPNNFPKLIHVLCLCGESSMNKGPEHFVSIDGAEWMRIIDTPPLPPTWMGNQSQARSIVFECGVWGGGGRLNPKHPEKQKTKANSPIMSILIGGMGGIVKFQFHC